MNTSLPAVSVDFVGHVAVVALNRQPHNFLDVDAVPPWPMNSKRWTAKSVAGRWCFAPKARPSALSAVQSTRENVRLVLADQLACVNAREFDIQLPQFDSDDFREGAAHARLQGLLTKATGCASFAGDHSSRM